MGWNKVYGDNFFQELKNKRFYFAHSYHVSRMKKYILGYIDYILRFPSMVRFDKIYEYNFTLKKVALMA